MKDNTFENHLDDRIPKWFAIRTNYKREKIALRELKQKGVISYLPIQKLVRRYNRKTKVVELPLIPCYLFVKITRQEYTKVLQCSYVNDFLRFSKNLISIPEEEINIIRKILSEEVEVSVCQTGFHQGDEVVIDSGNLYGLKGKLVKIEGKNSVLVDLQYLGYTLQLSIDPAMLRKVNRIQYSEFNG